MQVDQKGFMEDSSTTDNTRLMMDIMLEMEIKVETGLIILVDCEKAFDSLQGTTLTFAATCPVGQVRFNFHIFSRTSLNGRPRNLHTFSKVNLKYTKRTFPVGQARCSFHLPQSYNLQILLARGNGASTNVEPWLIMESYI